jgi:hypothetical protein
VSILDRLTSQARADIATARRELPTEEAAPAPPADDLPTAKPAQPQPRSDGKARPFTGPYGPLSRTEARHQLEEVIPRKIENAHTARSRRGWEHAYDVLFAQVNSPVVGWQGKRLDQFELTPCRGKCGDDVEDDRRFSHLGMCDPCWLIATGQEQRIEQPPPDIQPPVSW